MKYLLTILLFVSSFCYGQTLQDVLRRGSTTSNLFIVDSSNKSKYDTSFGIVETYLRDGSFLRGWGFVIDSLIIREGFVTVVPNALSVIGYSAKFDYDTVRIAIKVFSQPLACYIDNKKYYKFIPIKHLQNMEIYEDEHISISPNENYKKDEK